MTAQPATTPAPLVPRPSVIALAAQCPPMTEELARRLVTICPELAGTAAASEEASTAA